MDTIPPTSMYVSVMWGIIEFAIGFLAGGAIDLLFFKLYTIIDPARMSNVKLITLSILQLIVVIVLIQFSFTFPVSYLQIQSVGVGTGFYIRMGIMTAQLFMLQLGLSRLSEMIYSRDTERDKITTARLVFEAESSL